MRLIIRETQLSFRRAPVLSALSITTIAFALFVVGLFGLVALNLRTALSEVEGRVEIAAYLMRGTPVEVVMIATGDIEAFPGVDSVSYVSEEDALGRARTQLSEIQDLYDDLTENPLPASIEVSLSPEYRDSESVARVADWLRGFRFVEDVRFGSEWVERIDDIQRIAGVVGLVIGAAFAIASVIIIGTTVRMAVMHRANEIAVMRLVGATDGFIRGPFLLDGLVKGALGGLGAVGLNYAAYLAINNIYRATFFRFDEAFVLVLFGTLLGFAASAVSVARHLRGVEAG